MATETFTRLIDDLDGGKAERTVSFSWEGKDYSIDLSKKNIAAFEKALRPYVEAARSMPRKTGRTSGRSSGRSPSRSNGTGGVRAVRDWARENGYAVSDRGRIGAEVQSAYNAAN